MLISLFGIHGHFYAVGNELALWGGGFYVHQYRQLTAFLASWLPLSGKLSIVPPTCQLGFSNSLLQISLMANISEPHQVARMSRSEVRESALLPIGSLFRDPGPYRDLFANLGPYWVFISSKRSLFIKFLYFKRVKRPKVKNPVNI